MYFNQSFKSHGAVQLVGIRLRPSVNVSRNVRKRNPFLSCDFYILIFYRKEKKMADFPDVVSLATKVTNTVIQYYNIEDSEWRLAKKTVSYQAIIFVDSFASIKQSGHFCCAVIYDVVFEEWDTV